MGKKTKALLAQLQASQAQLAAALSDVKAPDPYTKAIGDDALNTLNWAKAGDYRQMPTGTFNSMIDPAMVKRQRELQTNAGAQGVSALGAPNSTLLNLNKQNLDDENALNASAGYQQNVSNAVGQAGAVAGGLGSQELQKKLSVLNSLQNTNSQMFGTYYNQAFKPGMLDSFGRAFANNFGGSLGSGLGRAAIFGTGGGG